MRAGIALLLISALTASSFADSSLIFGGASSDRVSLGTLAALNNLDPFSVIAWVNFDNLTQNSRIYQKGITPNDEIFFTNTTTLHIERSRVTTDVQCIAATSALPAIAISKWVYLAGTLDSSNVNNLHLYAGDQTTPATEATSYTTRTVGTGTVGNNSGAAAIVGNNSNALLAFHGKIAAIGIWNRVLSLSEIQNLQSNPQPTSGCVYFSYLGFSGTGTQADLSGNSNSGTVTGATVSTLGPPISIGGRPQ